jgi:alanyl-tRNA synthetase
MTPKNSAEIRHAFLDFFEEMGHQAVASAPLPDYDNPTLLFTNAGMNQFVDIFLGKEERPYKRAASSQKCMRVQGKHNDLENVGPSARHHTFFEMLGNFSFGDYFKTGAIRYAYDFLTAVCKIPEDKLWYTVHTEDDDAYEIWVQEIGAPSERVLRMGDTTNFWMMGDVGPCGPTSEIHYDWGQESCSCDEPDCGILLDNDCDRWLELWNLVFMQFNQDEDGVRSPLPKPGVDTGMGLERITAVIEQQPVTYETDLFVPAMNRVQALLNDTDEEREAHMTGYRVIADHGRAASFLIADGVLPGNVGRGYVLRMIIRRAARFGRQIGFENPFLAEITKLYITKMGDVYSELKRHQDHIIQTVTLEEERFAATLDVALAHLDLVLTELHQASQKTVPGKIAFDLYATHGLSLEITRDVAIERGYTVDEDGFLKAQQAHAEASGAGAFGQYEGAGGFFTGLLSELVGSGYLADSGVDYDPYSGPSMESEIVAIASNEKKIEVAGPGERIGIVTAATPFYLEAGGEVSDTGWITIEDSGARFVVEDIQKPTQGIIIHIGKIVQGKMSVGQLVFLEVDEQRRWDIRRNHTATHILHKELRSKLGNHVTQQGSLVAPDRLRFDFSHNEALNDETLVDLEKRINEAILANQSISAEYMSLKEATSAGAMALFGEKYGDIVRTIKIGAGDHPYSFELCGGLHVNATGDIGLFYFTAEEAVGAGLRRVEAVTGRTGHEYIQNRIALIEKIARELKSPIGEIDARLTALIEDNQELSKEISQLRRTQAKQQFERLLMNLESVSGGSLLRGIVENADMDGLREMADWFRDKVPSGAAVLASIKDEKPIIIVAVTKDLVEQGLRADNLVRELAQIVGGGGGGRPTLAQAGGKESEKLPEALEIVPDLIRSELDS